MPRLIASLLVGSSLGMSGALLQGMLKNGLVSPYLLGISAGSGLVIVTFITFGFSQLFIPLASWSGAILTTLIVFINENIYFNSREISLTNMSSIIRTNIENLEEPIVILRADSSVKHGFIVNLLDELRKIENLKIGISTEKQLSGL